LTLIFAVPAKTRSAAKGDLRGGFGWGLYKGGDVTLFGPGDHAQLYGTPYPPMRGDLPEVDLSAPDATFAVTMTNVPPGDYQVLASLDDDDSGGDSAGDPATFPSAPFGVSGDTHQTLDVALDYLE
jgi:hypothetical protein